MQYNPTMRLSLLRLLAFAIVIVVPIQGMTAITAGQCMAFGHHQDSAGQENHGHAGQAGDDQAAHSHSDEAPGNADDENGGAGAHCGPCTACCASASIAGPAPLSILPDPSNPPYLFSQLPPLGVQPHGLDRPPLAL